MTAVVPRLRRLVAFVAYALLLTTILLLVSVVRVSVHVDDTHDQPNPNSHGGPVYIVRTAAPPVDPLISDAEREQMLRLPEIEAGRLNEQIAQLNATMTAANADDDDGPEPFYYFAMVNAAFVQMLVNFLCNVRALDAGIVDRLLLLGTDGQTCEKLAKSGWPQVRCVDYGMRSSVQG